MLKLFKSFSECWCGATFAGDSKKKTLPVRRVAAIENSPQRISLSNFSNSTTSLTPEDLSLSLAGSDLHIFTMEELKAITRGFSTSNFIGSGGFGPVYKGSVDEKLRPGLKPQPVAVKLLDLEGSQGHREWLAEVIFLGQLSHPNLVKLIGYSYEEKHRLLVYEYMSKGSLENHLFKNVIVSLPWLTRLKIAVGAAKGLAFLHEADKPVIYRDFKASNILLDEVLVNVASGLGRAAGLLRVTHARLFKDYNVKLSDFGLAKDGPEGDETHVTTRVMGTHGYAAPEYIMTGHLTAKSDVYSFGVVLLELLTGRCSVDKSRPNREQNLVEWAKHYLFNPNKVDRIMDPRLDGQYSTKGAQKAAKIAYQCLGHSPKSRPDMKAVVEALEALLELKDIPMGPFVYTVVTENRGEVREKAQKNEENSERKEKGEAKESGKRKLVGHRHKIKFSQSCAQSDTALYKVYRSSPTRKLTPPEK